ncbi:hypothetical protein CF327_g4163 [Tilletia walkeri]|uniref:Uncharacterized protein n=1 Tax=Tilletia walkeri TaxID=117179 RepID=A0A8X7N3U7_9BASI|nr:hypothetical protein CF327_g4163 [Tilletia walkeri]KAE8266551.1 hypothetical protein A4X09_0g5802 [Tilletia walkeri]
MAGHPNFDHTPTQTEDHDQDPQPPICTEAFDGIPDDASSATSDELEDDDPVVAQYVSRERPVRSREEWQERREELKREQDDAERERRERELQEQLAREREAVQKRQKARKRRQERERRQRRSKERQEQSGKLRQHALRQVKRENERGLRLQDHTTREEAAIKERQRLRKRQHEKERRQRRKKEQQRLTVTLRPALLRQQSSREAREGLARGDDMTVNAEAIKERQRVRKRRREKERRKRRKSEQRGLEDARRQALMKEVKERAESRRRAEREKQEMLHFKEERLVEWLRDQEERRTKLGSQRLAKESQSQQLVEDENEHQDACNSELEADRELDPTAATPETPVTQVECLDVDVSGASPGSNDSESDTSPPPDLAGRTTINVTPRTQNRIGPIPRILRRPPLSRLSPQRSALVEVERSNAAGPRCMHSVPSVA